MIATNRPKRKKLKWTGECDPLDDWQIEYLQNQRQELMNLLNAGLPIMKYKECTIMNKEKIYLESAKKIVAQGGCNDVLCEFCAGDNEFECETLDDIHKVSVSMGEPLLDRFRSYIAEHERKPAKSPVRKSAKRFHANGGTLGWKKEEDVVRYFFYLPTYNMLTVTNNNEGMWNVIGKGGGLHATYKNGWGIGSSWQGDVLTSESFIEVTGADLDYLRKPDGDWEFCKVENGDTIIPLVRNNPAYVASAREALTGCDYTTCLGGYRWCKPRKKLTKAGCMELAIEETWEPDCSVCYKRAVEIYERLLEENGLA